MKHLGERLKDFRQVHGFTQPEMANLLGIGYRTYQDIEKTGAVAKADVLQVINTRLSAHELNTIFDKNDGENPKTAVVVKSTVEKELGIINEKLIRQEASVTVLSVTLAELLAKTSKRSIGAIAVELSKAIDAEADRLFSELKKR